MSAREAPRGFLNIDKPSGITSFEVVRRVRRAAGTKRVGHAGTLDPLATGVLPIAVGDATRLVDELVGARKRYRASIRLGEETDSYDAEGESVRRRDASALSVEAVRAALGGFAGEQLQVPPAYSAVKRAGVPAYQAARRGEPLELEARAVTVYALDLIEARADGAALEIVVEVACGKGFYVRSLAHDLGAALEVGGHVSALCRLAVGPFEVGAATGLEEAVRRLEAGDLETLVHAPDAVLLNRPALILEAPSVAELRQGRMLRAGARAVRRAGIEGELARAYGPDGRLVAVVRAGAIGGSWSPIKVFVN